MNSVSSRIRVLAVLFVLVTLPLAACSSSSKTPGSASSNPAEDVVFLTDKTVIRGRIVEETPDYVTVARDGRRAKIATSAVYAIERSEESLSASRAAELEPSRPAAAAKPVSGWYPRQDPSEALSQETVTWSDTKTLTDILGKEFAESFSKFPDFRLFAVPGGKIVFHDPRRWGYRAYLVRPNALHKPNEKGALAVPMPAEKDLPDAIAFLSPAQEIKSKEVEQRSSYTIPDCIYAKVLPESQSQAVLASQPFAGGKPSKGPNGDWWTLGLSRGLSSWFLYLHDNPQHSHAKIMKTTFAAYGDTLLVPEAMIDVETADGAVVSRIMVLPYPDDVPLDGSAPDPVTVYSGPPTDPTPVGTVALPPRQNIVLPTRRPSTKADVYVQHYDISASTPQSIVIAHGYGDPAGQVTLVQRELTPTTADERLRFDASAFPEERFPVVAWIYTRRVLAWKVSGGMLGRIESLVVPPLVRPAKLTKSKANLGVSHVVPLMFAGPKATPNAGAGAGTGLATGMGDALMRDALTSEAGRNLFTPNLTVSAPPSGGGSQSNVTYLQVVVPPHSATGGGLTGGGGPPSGMYLSQQAGWPSTAGFLPGAGTAAMGSTSGTVTNNVYSDPAGTMLYEPASGFNYSNYYLQNGGPSQISSMGIPSGPAPGAPNINVPFRRQQNR